jgi:N-acetylneuraminic acid mutarotase
MFVWGGMDEQGNRLDSGGAYNPTTDTWRVVNLDGAPSPREFATCVPMDGGVFVWGGAEAVALRGDGAVWDPASNTWSSISDSNDPSPRVRGIGLWTGEKVLLWGGEKFDSKQEKSGALFDPVENAWEPISTNLAPDRNREQGWAWTGASLYTFGNRDDGGGQVTNVLHRYDPVTNTWEAITTTETPAGRSNAFMVWTGAKLLVWGGLNASRVGINDGAAFDPATSTWIPLSTAQPPSARGCVPFRSGWKAWTGDRMLVAGGADINLVQKDLALYDPDADPNQAWTQGIAWDPPNAHEFGVGVWSGKEFILWGGTNGSLPTAGGSRWMP